MMDENDYITRRVDDQIAWYDNKSVWNQRIYKRLRIIEILCASTIPLIAGFTG
ncbi:MAG: SLATT domain-containing protein [Pseudomonadota bacterium]